MKYHLLNKVSNKKNASLHGLVFVLFYLQLIQFKIEFFIINNR